MKRFRKKFSEKIRAIGGNPVKTARSFALGTFLGVTPLVGLQVITGLLLAFFLRLNKTAVVTGVLNTNWTKGLLLYPINYKIGCFLMGSPATANITAFFRGNVLHHLLQGGPRLFLALLLGGIITGSVLATLYYILIISILKKNKSMNSPGNNQVASVPQPYALITGASQGLGKALARELASRNFNLLLVSLKDEGLPTLCASLEAGYSIDARYFETDFREKESVYEVARWAGTFPRVSILINNAGLGGTRSFDAASPDYLDTIIQVNVRATSILTRLMLPQLRENPRAFILNVASMASFSPFAYKTVYPASKAFVYSFSRGLSQELRNSNVFVSVIHPGPIKTNAEVTARIEKQGIFGKMGLVPVEKLARIAITRLFKRDSLILPGFMNKVNWLLMNLLPNAWKLVLLSRAVKKEINVTPTLKPVAA